jgi:hypothetical protein
MLFRVAPDIDAFIKLSLDAPSRTPLDAPNSILTLTQSVTSSISVRLLSQCLIKMITVAYTSVLMVQKKYKKKIREFLKAPNTGSSRI